MAQFVSYFANNVTYEEGPFVISEQIGHARIEVEQKNWHCPVLLDSSICAKLRKEKRFHGGNLSATDNNIAKLVQMVDYLNNEVKLRRIVLDGNVWVAK